MSAHHTNSLLVDAIDPVRLDAVRKTGADGHGNQMRPFAATGQGEPLRCCLRYAKPGEQITLISYAPFEQPSVWREVARSTSSRSRAPEPTPKPAPTSLANTPKAKPSAKPSAASNANSPAASGTCSTPPRHRPHRPCRPLAQTRKYRLSLDTGAANWATLASAALLPEQPEGEVRPRPSDAVDVPVVREPRRSWLAAGGCRFPIAGAAGLGCLFPGKVIVRDKGPSVGGGVGLSLSATGQRRVRACGLWRRLPAALGEAKAVGQAVEPARRPGLPTPPPNPPWL
jgi:Protein of unknown function (DUF1203)